MSEILIPEVLTEEQIVELDRAGSSVLADARLFKVTDELSYRLAAAFRQDIRRKRDAVTADIEPIKKSQFEAHHKTCELERAWTKNYDTADKLMESEMQAFRKQQRDLENKLKAQQEAEAKRIAELNRKQIAEIYEEAGEPEKAKEVLAAPVSVPTPVVPRLVPKVTAAPTTTRWRVTKVDVYELAKWIVDHKDLAQEFLEAREGKLANYISNAEGKVQIGGVEFESYETIGVRTAL